MYINVVCTMDLDLLHLITDEQTIKVLTRTQLLYKKPFFHLQLPISYKWQYTPRI